jgi:hypothetical protein
MSKNKYIQEVEWFEHGGHQLHHPNGWNASDGWGETLVLTIPTRSGSITIDFEKRGFALGFTSVRGMKNPHYSGRGWRQKLVDAAINALLKATKRP